MARVVVLLDLSDEGRQRFRTFFESKFPGLSAVVVGHRDELPPHLPDAEVLMSFGKPLGPQADALISSAPNLKWIQSLGTGVDNIIDLPSLPKHVLITNTHGIQGISVSESAIFLMQALGRDFPRLVANQARKIWDRKPMQLLHSKTVGILGIGAIALELAPRCKAMGMTTVGISSSRRDVKGFDRVYARSELHQAVRELDYLVVLVPYSPETRHIVDRTVLKAMKPSAYLVNLARGGIVDEAALTAALCAKTIAGAASDVFETEPLPADHPLWTLDNLIITPHVAGYSDDYYDQALPIIELNVFYYLTGQGEKMRNIIDRNGRE